MLRTIRHTLGPVTFETVSVVPRTLAAVQSRVDPLLRHLPARDREGLYFTRDLPSDCLFISFFPGDHSSRYSIEMHPRDHSAYPFFIDDECPANKANHARESIATCSLYVVDYGHERRPVLMTKIPVRAGMRVTYEYKLPPQPCIELPPW